VIAGVSTLVTLLLVCDQWICSCQFHLCVQLNVCTSMSCRDCGSSPLNSAAGSFKHQMGLQSYLNHSLIAAILVCVTAVTDDSDESQGDSPDDVTMPEESHNRWPQVMMIVTSVYLIVHIIGDVIKVLRFLTWFISGCPTVARDSHTQPGDKYVFTLDPASGSMEAVSSSENGRSLSAMTGDEMGDDLGDSAAASTVKYRNLSTGSAHADPPALLSPTPQPCKCVNEQVHICALTVDETTRIQSTVIPKIWTTADGIKYHLFEQCAGQNNAGQKQCRVMCAHCLRKKNKQL
jgi:hypothetical protein